MNVQIEPAKPSELAAVQGLLRFLQLPGEDIAENFRHFFTARVRDQVVGVLGVEPYGDIALIRSFAVLPDYRGQNIARDLWRRAEAYARELGIQKLYLLTTSIQRLCAMGGFRVIPRSEAPAVLQETPEFKTLCPSTAVCMCKSLLSREI